MEHLKGFGSLFYVVNPYKTMFEKIEDVPNPGYLATGFPYFFAMIVIEQVILKLQGKRGIRINDGLMSMANGIIMLMKEILLKGVLMGAYIYVYENLRIVDLAWDSLWTWIIAAVLTDLGYYWVHRAAHGRPQFQFSFNSSPYDLFFYRDKYSLGSPSGTS